MKVVKVLGIIIVALVALFILSGAVLYLTVDIDRIVNEQKEKFLPEVEKQIGRKVSVGQISTTLLTGIGVDIAKDRLQSSDQNGLKRGREG